MSVDEQCIAASCDRRSYVQHATVIASVLRRTRRPVWVKLFCQEFLPGSFESGRLRVEFVKAEARRCGRYPSHVTPAVFDRLQVIRDGVEWDRCLVMDYDQVVLCDIAPLFDLEFGSNLLAARMHGPGIDLAYAMKHYRKNESIPAGWEHAASNPYFCMGPLMNLTGMREAGTWEKVLAAHAAFQAEEQIALTAATEGRTMGIDLKWNLFPGTDLSGEEVPEGVIHWTGTQKPWNSWARAWRPEIWESEECSWEALRNGWWEKPLAVEINPAGWESVNGLARRGWRVKVLLSAGYEPESGAGAAVERGEAAEGSEKCPCCSRTIARSRSDGDRDPDAKWKRRLSFPDVEVVSASGEREALPEFPADAAMVRFGPGVAVENWLRGRLLLPRVVVVQGAASAAALGFLRRAGYGTVAVIRRTDWPAGGPAPAAFDGWRETVPNDVTEDEDVYLRVGAAP